MTFDTQKSERYLLSACLAGHHEKALHGLKPEHFLSPKNRAMFLAMIGALAKHSKIDIVVIAQEVQNTDVQVVHGWTSYAIAELANDFVSDQTIETHRAVLDKAWRQLKVLREIKNLRDEIQSKTVDPQDALRSFVSRIYPFMTRQEQSRPRLFREVLSDVTDHLDAVKAGKVAPGLSLGLGFDNFLRLAPGTLTIIAARPSMGKSTFARTVAANIAKSGGTAGFFSIEDSAQTFGLRTLAAENRINLTNLQRAELDSSEWMRMAESYGTLSELPLVVDDQGGLTVADLIVKSKMIKSVHGLNALFVDYLSLLESGNEKSETRAQEVGKMTKALAALAKDLQVPVVLVSQLNRKCEERMDKRPMLSDLLESGRIEEHAHAVIFLFREHYYFPESGAEQTLIEAIIAKHKNGRTGTVPVYCDLTTNYMREWRDGVDGVTFTDNDAF